VEAADNDDDNDSAVLFSDPPSVMIASSTDSFACWEEGAGRWAGRRDSK
jgi:hypothetical protein